MTAQQVMTAVVFLGFMAILSVGLTIDTSKIGGLTNQSDDNLTILTTGTDVSQVRICDFVFGNIPVLTDFLWGVDCVADYVGYLFGFGSTSSEIGYLQLIIVAISMSAIYVGIRLFRGGG